MKHVRRTTRPAVLALLLVVLGCGALGAAYLYSAGAATYAAEYQAEWASLKGNVLRVDQIGADSRTAVRFGDIGTCTTEQRAEYKDQHLTSVMHKTAWPRLNASSDAVVYFQTKALPEEYYNYVHLAALQWSAINCIDARAVNTCPVGVNCVDMVMRQTAPTPTLLGRAHLYLDDTSRYTQSALIDLFADTLAGTSPYVRRVLVAHEMGHTLGLAHRATENTQMYPVLRSQTHDGPDDLDHHNILTLYGQWTKYLDDEIDPPADPTMLSPAEFQSRVPPERIVTVDN